MFPTAEARWFFHGKIPAEIWDWFNHGGSKPETQPPRTDHYLRIDESDSLGIKLREGRVELKQRYGQQEIISLGKFAKGRVEQWHKWSFVLAEQNDVALSLGSNASDSRWIGVRKERKIRTWQVTENQKVVEINNTGAIGMGCTWEIAKVNVDGREEDKWWSVGFEAFGNQGELRDALLSITDIILSMEKAPRLEPKNSFGYPIWLRQEGVLP